MTYFFGEEPAGTAKIISVDGSAIDVTTYIPSPGGRPPEVQMCKMAGPTSCPPDQKLVSAGTCARKCVPITSAEKVPSKVPPKKSKLALLIGALAVGTALFIIFRK